MRTRLLAPLAVLLLVPAGCAGGSAGEDTVTVTQTETTTLTATRTTTETVSPSGGTTEPGGGPTTGSGQTDRPQDEPTDDVPFYANTRTDVGDPSGRDTGGVTDLRMGGHAGYDRVVFEFSGSDYAGWTVGYTDNPRSAGSGAPIDVTGDAVLEVTLQPVDLPTETGNAYAGPDRLAVAGTAVVTETALDTVFEGNLHAFVGMTGGRHPFRVYALQDPPRVVVDVRTD